MTKPKLITPYLLITLFLLVSCLEDEEIKEGKKLEGTPISSSGELEQKTLSKAFTEDYNEEFIASELSGGWVGIELEEPHRITKVGWAQTNSSKVSNYLFGIFEGANDPSFIDAIPLYMITNEEAETEKMNYADIKVNYSFKYLRYVGPFNQSCVISGLEFYGYEAPTKLEENEEILYQPTNLPLIIIHTEDDEQPTDKEEYVNCTVTVIDGGKRDKKAEGKIKLRGNATMRLLKRPYQIKFDSKEKMLDLPSKAKKWTLLANQSDKTLLRNYLAFKVSSILGLKYTPACRYVDLIFNGQFEGNYNLCDKPEVGKGRLELAEMDETCNEEPEISGGYLIEACGYAKQDEFYGTSAKGILYSIRYPKREDITEEQLDYLNEKLNQLEEEVYKGITDKVDIDSLIKYTLVQEIAANCDAVWSTYMYKERSDDKLYFGPVWDFDIAFGNDMRAYPLKSKTNFIFKYSGSAGTMKDFFTKIYNNEDVLQELKDKWIEITETKKSLTNEVMKKLIDEATDLIKESRILNFKRWEILIRHVMINPVVLCTYEKEIEYLKGFMDERFEQLDGIIANATIESINEKVSSGWGGQGGWNNNRNNRTNTNDNKNNNLAYQRDRNNTRNDWGNWGNRWRDPLGEIQKNCIEEMN